MGTDSSTKPPPEMEHRTLTVQADVINTVEVPCDPHDPDFARWFDTGEGMQPVRKNNRVKALIEGDQAFSEMLDAIETADFTADYIYLLNWWAEDVPLAGPGRALKTGSPSAHLFDLLANAVSHGVQVRAMFWDQPLNQNTPEVARINTFKNPLISDANGGAILDNNTLNLGSHHQKILIVKGNEGLIGFCGGVDFNSDRIVSIARQPGSPMHDVHCRIDGSAALDLLKIFTDRWTDHPDSPAIDKAKGTLRGLTPPTAAKKGDQYVQIGRTFGNGSKHAGIKSVTGKSFYTFAPSGERTAEKLIHHAVEQATRFIYVEDQYLADMNMSNKLLAQLPNIERLIILIPHPSLNDHPNIWRFQKHFVDNLGGSPKVVVCYLKEAFAAVDPKVVLPSTVRTYVHAKMWVIDDKFAIIGSANCGQRSYTHDSEVVAGIYDESKDSPCTVHFAHDLRMRLWADHLQLKKADVFDPIGSAVHWFKPSLASRIAIFDQNAAKDPKNFNNLVPDSDSEPFGG